MEREDEIKLIAYNIWEEEGCTDGNDCEHWYRAETIWEQQQQPAAEGIKAEAKQPVKRSTRTAAAAKRKSRKTSD